MYNALICDISMLISFCTQIKVTVTYFWYFMIIYSKVFNAVVIIMAMITKTLFVSVPFNRLILSLFKR